MMSTTAYSTIRSLAAADYSQARVLLIGAGWMANEYCRALAALRIRDVTVVSRAASSSAKYVDMYGFQGVGGGYEDQAAHLGGFDLTIVATPVGSLRRVTDLAVKHGNANVLVEKPGALHSSQLHEWEAWANSNGSRIRVAYNRHTYPNVLLLKDLVADEGGITSCRYTFTELVHTIDFTNNDSETYSRWGISNSLHVIGLAHDLIGLPEKLFCTRAGGIDWHPAGEQFAGAGVAHSGAVFSYHADWSSAGRWSVEVFTQHNAYRLMPLEQLWRSARKTFEWTQVPCDVAFPDVKQGVAEQLAIMLRPELEESCPLVTLGYASDLTKVAETICGYITPPPNAIADRA